MLLDYASDKTFSAFICFHPPAFMDNGFAPFSSQPKKSKVAENSNIPISKCSSNENEIHHWRKMSAARSLVTATPGGCVSLKKCKLK